jgi:hypothetical protein
MAADLCSLHPHHIKESLMSKPVSVSKKVPRRIQREMRHERQLSLHNHKHCNRGVEEYKTRGSRKPSFEKYLKKQPTRALKGEVFIGNPTEDKAYEFFLAQNFRVARDNTGKYLLFEKRT